MSKKKKGKKSKRAAGGASRERTSRLLVEMLTQAAGDLFGDLVVYASKRYKEMRKRRERDGGRRDDRAPALPHGAEASS